MSPWLARNVFWPVTERLRGRDTMRRFGALQQSERLTQDQLQELQAAKLQRLLRIAGEHCPFYAERFRAAGLNVEKSIGLAMDGTVWRSQPKADKTGRGALKSEICKSQISEATACLSRSSLASQTVPSIFEAFRQLPTLSRGDVRANLECMVWHDSPFGRPQRYTTGGSSGQPLIFYTDAARQAADWAARLRTRLWWGIRPGDPERWVWGAPVELRAQDRLRALRDRLLNQEILSAFNMTPATMDAYIARLARVRPACFYGYASSLALLARHAESRGLPPGALGSPRLRAVFTTGEVLLERDRQIIEEMYGAPAVIEYGCRDGGLIACACPARRLHVPQENCFLELLDEGGRPVAPGEVGEVVVTPLETFAMPLLRYRNGDLARFAEGPCPCGRPSQTLLEVQGRTTDQIVCRDGAGLRRMHALSLMYVLREVEGLQQFRIVQPDLDHLDVSIVADARLNGQVESAIRHGLAERMGEGVAITIHRCDAIPPTASGKHACVISHVSA